MKVYKHKNSQHLITSTDLKSRFTYKHELQIGYGGPKYKSLEEALNSGDFKDVTKVIPANGVQVSVNCYITKDRVIRNHQDLLNAARNKKSVYSRTYHIKSAGWMMNMPYCLVVNLIEKGELYIVHNLKHKN